MVTARKTAAAPAAKKTGGAIVKWDEQLAARALKAKKTAGATGGNFISIAGGKMSYKGNDIPGSSMDAVILSSVFENALYEGAYDPKNPAPPVCFAFAEDEDELRPHEKSGAPQAESCASCPHNEWGSNGDGKACKNTRRLGLIPADAMDKGPAGIKEAEVAYFKVPVTSVKGWSGFVNQCAAVEKPPLAFVTTIAAVPDSRTQVKVSFNASEEISKGELIGALLEKADVVDAEIQFPYEPLSASAAPAKPARGASRGRAAPAAKTAAKPAIKKAAAPVVKKPGAKKY